MAMASPSAACSSSRVRDAPRRHAVPRGHRGHVEGRQVEPRSPRDRLERGEPLEDRVLLVAQDQERHGHVVGGGGPEPLDRVLGRALADNAHHWALGLGELHPDRRGQAETEPAAGAEVVAARAREPQAIAHRQGARGRLQHHDAVFREHVGQRGGGGRGAHRVGLLGRLRGRALGRPLGAGLRDLPYECRERERGVGHQRVAHRRARRLVGIARDRHQRRALRKRGPGDVGVVGEHGRARHEHEVVSGERLAEGAHGRRQQPLEGRVVLREAQPPAAGGGSGPHRHPQALRQGHGGVPARL